MGVRNSVFCSTVFGRVRGGFGFKSSRLKGLPGPEETYMFTAPQYTFLRGVISTGNIGASIIRIGFWGP